MKRYQRLTALICAAVLAMAMLAGCSAKIDPKNYATTAVATFGDQNIYLDEVNFLTRYSQLTYESYYLPFMGEEFWDVDIYGNGTTMAQIVKEDVMTALYQTKVLNAAAADYGVELSDVDKQKVEKTVTAFLGDVPDKFKEAAGVTEELVTKIFTENAIANRVWEAMVADAEVEDLEAMDYSRKEISYLLVASDANAEKPMEDKDLEKLAKELEKRVKKGDKMTDIRNEMKEEEGCTVTATTEVIAEETYKNAFGEAAWALKTDETAVVFVEEKGWYVALCTNDDDTEAGEKALADAIAKRKAALFSDMYKDLLDESPAFKVNEDIWAQISFSELIFEAPEETEAETEAETAAK